MLTRKLGKTGLTVSAVGLGCAQLGSPNTDYAVRLVRRALDLGVTYIDLARGYRDAEIKVGLALRVSPLAGERERLVISTKTSRRTREDAWREIHESLERFEQRDPQKAELVKLRYFAGLTIPQAAEVLGISSTTADRHWAYARAWLYEQLHRD